MKCFEQGRGGLFQSRPILQGGLNYARGLQAKVNEKAFSNFEIGDSTFSVAKRMINACSGPIELGDTVIMRTSDLLLPALSRYLICGCGVTIEGL